MAKRKQGLKEIKDGFKEQFNGMLDITKAEFDGLPTTYIKAGKAVNAGRIEEAGRVAKKAFLAPVNMTKGMVRSAKGIAKMIKGAAHVLFNHKEWYTNYDLKGLVGANFARRKGIPEPGLTQNGTTFSGIPSACGVDVELTIPHTDSNSWAQAINIMYNQIRRANAGATNFTPADLEHYVVAVRSLHAAYYMLRRAYAALKNYDIYDASVPMSLFAAMGLDYTTFRENAANMRQFANIMSVQLHAMAPLNINLFDRTDWMFSNFFADSDDVKASVYCFNPLAMYTYTLGDSGYTVSRLALAAPSLTASATGATYSSVIENIQKALNNFASINTFQIIAGDILKAFGPSSLFPNVVWDENISVPTIYDEAALSQIQNGFALGSGWTTSFTPAIDSSTKLTTSGYSAIRGQFGGDYNIHSLSNLYFTTPFINTYKDSVDDGELISLTRFCVSGPTDARKTDNCYYGTEMIVNVRVINSLNSASTIGKLQSTKIGQCISTANPFDEATSWAAMDWAPMTCVYSTEKGCLFALWDFNNYAKLDSSQINSYHDFAVLSMLKVPELVKQSNSTLYN